MMILNELIALAKEVEMEDPIHGNFFESRVTDYAKGALSGTWNDVWGKA